MSNTELVIASLLTLAVLLGVAGITIRVCQNIHEEKARHGYHDE